MVRTCAPENLEMMEKDSGFTRLRECPGMTRKTAKMLFTADHDEPRRALQEFIAAEINPHVDEWEDNDIFPAHELFKKLGNL